MSMFNCDDYHSTHLSSYKSAVCTLCLELSCMVLTICMYMYAAIGWKSVLDGSDGCAGAVLYTGDIDDDVSNNTTGTGSVAVEKQSGTFFYSMHIYFIPLPYVAIHGLFTICVYGACTKTSVFVRCPRMVVYQCL